MNSKTRRRKRQYVDAGPASTRKPPPVTVHLYTAQLKSREVGRGGGGCFEKRLHVSGTPVTHGALCYASLVVCHCGVPVCAVCGCTSSVLTCDAHLFLADGAVALSLAAASTRKPPPALRE